jgi:ADP-heptose:LPS heptosyltransferase
MVWTRRTAAHEEARKVRFEVIPYVDGYGIDLGLGSRWTFPAAIPADNATPADLLRLSIFSDGAFEWAMSSFTLPVFDDAAAALAAWWRLVQVDGDLILYLPHADHYPAVGQDGCDPRFRRDLRPEDVVAMMGEVAPDWDLVESQIRTKREEAAFLQVFRKLAPGSGQRESWREPQPQKRAAVVRYGAYGDALWASSLFPALKDEGYHLTVYTQAQGYEALAHDPHVDRFVLAHPHVVAAEDMIAFWQWERVKYQRWINLIHSVEARLLWVPTDVMFHQSDEVRRRCGGENYLQAVHEFAGIPYVPRQKFYPSADDLQWATAERARYDGPVVVLNAAGSTWPKWWPYTERFSALLADRGVHTVVVGDYRGEKPALSSRYGHFVGRDWPIRRAFTFAALADCVVGEESSLVNAVAFEPVPKIVLLSHSPADSLTRDWVNTVGIEPTQMPCHPCHRIHEDASYCVLEKKTQSAGCQALIQPGTVADLVLERIAQRAAA